MDARVRTLKRAASMGDVEALEALERATRRSSGDRLKPCIVICPIGTNHSYMKDGKLRYMRGKYVSILLTLGYWKDMPTVARGKYAPHCAVTLKNDFFLQTGLYKKVPSNPWED